MAARPCPVVYPRPLAYEHNYDRLKRRLVQPFHAGKKMTEDIYPVVYKKFVFMFGEGKLTKEEDRIMSDMIIEEQAKRGVMDIELTWFLFRTMKFEVEGGDMVRYYDHLLGAKT